MFGIGTGELVFIILMVLMLFGSDKVPELARGFAKTMTQIKQATNQIKHEITKSVDETGIVNEVKEAINPDKIKESLGVDEIEKDLKEATNLNPTTDVEKEISKVKEDFENLTGPIKRQK